MATVYSDAYWTGTYTYTRVKVDYSGTSATATLLYTRTNTYSGATGANGATFSFGGNSVNFSKTFYGQQTDAYVASVNFTISTSGGYYSGSTANGGYLSFSGGVNIPAQASAPTGLGANNIVRGVENFTANVYISSWGSGGTSAGRYRELQCWTYDPNNLAQPRRYQTAYGDSLSGNITVSNSSSYTQAYGPLNITGNTLYTLGLYASNGASAVGSQRLGDYTTLAYAPVLTLNSINGSTLTINYTTRADGGRYEKTYEYSIDDGTTWTTFATLSTGAASSGSFTTTGYTPGTPYVIKSRVTTQSGTTNANDLTIYEPPKNKFYGPVNGEATNAYKMYGSVNGQTKEIKKLYGSVNGESIRIF